MKAFLVEDDTRLLTSISSFLKMQKFEVLALQNGLDAYERCIDDIYDIYILDINLPHISGIELIARIRSLYHEAPIIMITASININTLVEAFNEGCNEYIKKPFNLKELEVRMNNLLDIKNCIQLSSKAYVERNTMDLYEEGTLIKLRPKLKRLLYLLLLNKNTLVGLSSIESFVWRNEDKEQFAIRQLVNLLREKIPYVKIENVFNEGYILHVTH
jgi:DNA-binding response OmpR family regulator